MATPERPPRGRPPSPRRTPTRPGGDPQSQEAAPPPRAVVRRRRDPCRRDPRDDEVDGAHDIAEVFPLRVFPTPSACARTAARTCSPTATTPSTRSGRRTTWSRAARTHRRTSAWIAAQCAREALAEVGFGADIWAAADRGDVTPELAPLMVRSLLTAGVDTTVHGHQRRPPCVRRAARPVGPAASRALVRPCGVRRGDQARVTRADLLPNGHHATSTSTARHPRRPQGPPGPRRREPRPTALGQRGPVRPLPRSLGSRRLRHGHPPVRGPARRASGGGSGADRYRAPDPRLELAGTARAVTTTTPSGPGSRSR